eukprot:CAMPEP_0172485424 /NCGR_PEP_ID=MMETSP1066-20121228/13481_1 /TAXON_ID=671091 /ORGANISM="Coscinodiscus wailesii, Strain CCMP2513" /LENGTH=371 /DNA_ID=CAMNT_0013250705 /DNA_START=106 /DNA_END=1221 /DNA_ORIENTATION=-
MVENDINMEEGSDEDDEILEDNGHMGEFEHPSTVDMILAGASNAASLSNQETSQDNVAAAKRKEIQTIMRDKTLTDLERRLKIQYLMDGRVSGAPGGRRDMVNRDDTRDEVVSCAHYERNCNIIAPCCNKAFGCRVCHDEMSPPGHGPMDRFAIKEIICKECNTRQETSNKCVKCGVTFGEYHCDKCNLWMALGKKPFHCSDCGFCRVGGRDAFRHCHHCCMCISVTVFETHNCMKDKYKNNCPVCREDMFSSRQSPQDLPCGHAIHAHCFRKLAGFDYRCPICKKTVVSQASMAAAWSARARDIAMQPMPSDLARVVNIMCNDCETKSENRNWHFLGVQCPGCSSFNTVVEQVISSGGESEHLPDVAASS